jgi:hypothetical protein
MSEEGRKTLEEPVADRMFLFLWNDYETNYVVESLRGLDADGKVLYEKSFQ